jgi:hypothetical protein
VANPRKMFFAIRTDWFDDKNSLRRAAWCLGRSEVDCIASPHKPQMVCVQKLSLLARVLSTYVGSATKKKHMNMRLLLFKFLIPEQENFQEFGIQLFCDCEVFKSSDYL